jgi:uncharacterized repeat protein (TIGR02543 family)
LTEIAGNAINAPQIPTKEGFVFEGWYLSLSSLDLYEFTVMPSENITLYADWGTEGLEYQLINDDTEYQVLSGSTYEVVNIILPKRHDTKIVSTIALNGFKEAIYLETISLSIGIKTIENNAFWGCSSLISIIIPESVESIGNRVFELCYQLLNITVDQENTTFKSLLGVLYSADGKRLIRYPQAKADTTFVIDDIVEIIEGYAFSDCHNITNLTIGSSVTTLRTHAFFKCTNLLSIVIPDSVTTVEIYIFRDCVSLESVTFGMGMTEISSYMFNNCVALTSVVIPSHITFIAYGAFYDCTHLESVYIERSSGVGITLGGIFMFANTASGLKIYVPDEASVTAYKTASNWSSYASKIYIKP